MSRSVFSPDAAKRVKFCPMCGRSPVVNDFRPNDYAGSGDPSAGCTTLVNIACQTCGDLVSCEVEVGTKADEPETLGGYFLKLFGDHLHVPGATPEQTRKVRNLSLASTVGEDCKTLCNQIHRTFTAIAGDDQGHKTAVLPDVRTSILLGLRIQIGVYYFG